MSTTAQKKLEALGFWRKHGLDATRDAFAVSRSTLYAWRAKHRAGGLPALQDRSRAPRRPRRRFGRVRQAAARCAGFPVE